MGIHSRRSVAISDGRPSVPDRAPKRAPARFAAAAERPSDAILAAYHDAGHTIAARVIGNASRRIPGSLLDDWLAFTAAGVAAERELVSRLGVRWRRLTRHAGHDLETCYWRIREETGEDPGDWIRLHWIRAVRRATRLLTGRWDEVVRLAESSVLSNRKSPRATTLSERPIRAPQ